MPIHEYGRTADGRSITGGYVYRGCDDALTLEGTYFFADYETQPHLVVPLRRDHVQDSNFTGADRRARARRRRCRSTRSPRSARTASGEIYICDQNGGEVFKIVPTNPTIKPTDFDCNGEVDVTDLLRLLQEWGDCDGCIADLDGDGEVTTVELLRLLAEWG